MKHLSFCLLPRMIQCGTHDDYDDQPHVPMITGILPKRPKQDSITDALTAAATAVAKPFSPPATFQFPISSPQMYTNTWHEVYQT